MAKEKRILRALATLLIILVSVFALTGCGKKEEEVKSSEPAYLEPLNNYFQGIQNKDAEQILKAFPDFMDMTSRITSEDIDDLYDSYKYLYGENIKFDYSFGEAIAIEESELSEIEEQISAMYEDAGDIDFTAGYSVPVTITISGDGVVNSDVEENLEEESEDDTNQELSNSGTEEDEMYVFEYNGNWYTM